METVTEKKVSIDKYGQITRLPFFNEEARFKKMGYLECLRKVIQFRTIFEKASPDTQQILQTLQDNLYQGINEL